MPTVDPNAGVMFDGRSATRIANVVRRAERTPAPPHGGPQPARGAGGAFWAKIVGESHATPGRYCWTQVGRSGGAWSETSPRVFCSSCSAVEVNGKTGIPASTYVLLSWNGDSGTAPPTDGSPATAAAGDGDTNLATTSAPYPEYVFSIDKALPPPGEQAMVLQLTRPTNSSSGSALVPNWDYIKLSV